MGGRERRRTHGQVSGCSAPTGTLLLKHTGQYVLPQYVCVLRKFFIGTLLPPPLSFPLFEDVIAGAYSACSLERCPHLILCVYSASIHLEGKRRRGKALRWANVEKIPVAGHSSNLQNLVDGCSFNFTITFVVLYSSKLEFFFQGLGRAVFWVRAYRPSISSTFQQNVQVKEWNRRWAGGGGGWGNDFTKVGPGLCGQSDLLIEPSPCFYSAIPSEGFYPENHCSLACTHLCRLVNINLLLGN